MKNSVKENVIIIVQAFPLRVIEFKLQQNKHNCVSTMVIHYLNVLFGKDFFAFLGNPIHML